MPLKSLEFPPVEKHLTVFVGSVLQVRCEPVRLRKASPLTLFRARRGPGPLQQHRQTQLGRVLVLRQFATSLTHCAPANCVPDNTS